jgi:serine/threonine-protein phosphatase 6 regulatory ankyrin repeat subunit A
MAQRAVFLEHLRPNDLSTVDRLLRTAFETPDALPALVRSEPALLEARTGLDETALHYLAVENQLRAVILLVEAGAEVNTMNNCGGTPLSEAASLGYVELVRYLLSQGALLSLPGQNEPTLHEAARGGNAEVVQLLLAAGAAIDEQNDLKETALHLAAEADDRLPVLEVLLRAGANPAIERIFDETPLDVALEAGCNACVAALLAAGAPRGSGAS